MLALPGVVAALLIALLTSSIAQAAERRALLVTEARGFVHPSIPIAEAYFIALGERSNRLT